MGCSRSRSVLLPPDSRVSTMPSRSLCYIYAPGYLKVFFRERSRTKPRAGGRATKGKLRFWTQDPGRRRHLGDRGRILLCYSKSESVQRRLLGDNSRRSSVVVKFRWWYGLTGGFYLPEISSGVYRKGQLRPQRLFSVTFLEDYAYYYGL